VNRWNRPNPAQRQKDFPAHLERPEPRLLRRSARLRPTPLIARLNRLPVRPDSAGAAVARPPPVHRVRQSLARVGQFSHPRQRADVLPSVEASGLSPSFGLVSSESVSTPP